MFCCFYDIPLVQCFENEICSDRLTSRSCPEVAATEMEGQNTLELSIRANRRPPPNAFLFLAVRRTFFGECLLASKIGNKQGRMDM